MFTPDLTDFQKGRTVLDDCLLRRKDNVWRGIGDDMAKSSEFRISIGDVTVGLRCEDREFADVVRAWCSTFCSAKEPDFWLEIELVEGRPASEIQSLLTRVRLKADGGSFHTVPPLWSGEISWAQHWLKFRTERGLFKPTIQPRFLNVLLSYVYNTVCEYQREAEREAYLFHGCGVSTNAGTYLFTGPSGAGKTTVARLAGPRTVLNDEVVLLRHTDTELWLSGTPLLGGVNRRTAGWYRLRAVLMLKHGDEARMHALSRRDAYQRFLSQVFDTAPLIPPEGNRERRSYLEGSTDLAAWVVKNVPVYELSFAPDCTFWPVVEQL